MPKRKSGADIIPEGEIQLRHGRHWGPNKGFGAAHIWAEHQKEMQQAGFTIREQVADYVASIVQTGSAIYYEGGHHTRQKITIIRSSVGTAVLELKHEGQTAIWSVVTAYSRKNANGTRIGAVQ